jgi:hypothetical protein
VEPESKTEATMHGKATTLWDATRDGLPVPEEFVAIHKAGIHYVSLIETPGTAPKSALELG